MLQNIVDFLAVRSSLPSAFFAGAGDTVYAILGQTALITCAGYDRVRLNATAGGNVSDVYSLRWFKNQRSTDYILFTYLDLPPHRITMPQNEWKERNISFAIQDQPLIRLPNVTFRDDATYICDLTPASRNTPVISEIRLRIVGRSSLLRDVGDWQIGRIKTKFPHFFWQISF
jgi:hypothetical protein